MIGADSAEHLWLPERTRRVQRHHGQDLFGRNARLVVLKSAHFGKQTQIVIARQTVRAQADIEFELAQSLKLKRRMSEILVAARAMNDVESACRSCQQIKIALYQL